MSAEVWKDRSADTFVVWIDRRPSSDQLRAALERYVGAAAKVEFVGGRLFATFSAERHFEVFERPGRLDVTTRQQDEFVNAVADGFAHACARYWKGAVER